MSRFWCRIPPIRQRLEEKRRIAERFESATVHSGIKWLYGAETAGLRWI